MPLPESIKVGGFRYVLACGEDDVELEARERQAQTNHKLLRISLRTGHEKRRPETVLHELLHIVAYQTNLDAAWDDKQEDYVERIGLTLYAILKDNPELLQYWLED